MFGTYLFINRTGQSQRLINYLKLENKIPQKAGSFAISAIIYKAVMPFRIAFSLMVIPAVCYYLGDGKEEVDTGSDVTQIGHKVDQLA